MNGVQTRFKCKLDVKRCKRFVFPPSSLLPRSNALKTKAIRYFQTDRTLTRIVSPPLSAIIAMTSLVNVVSAAAVNRTDNFAYNTETNDGRVETQTVFKVENQKFLHRHLKYNYIYDNSGRISQKEVLKWNESTQSFEKHHSLNFFYTDDVTVEYALWNEQSNAYTDIKQKAVYRQTDSSVLRYLSYEWDEKNNDWSLTADHHMTDESVQLLAEK